VPELLVGECEDSDDPTGNLPLNGVVGAAHDGIAVAVLEAGQSPTRSQLAQRVAGAASNRGELGNVLRAAVLK